MRNLIFLILILEINLSYSQGLVSKWYFGKSAGIDFSTGTAIELMDGQLSTNEGCTVISDRYTDSMLFYSDGSTIWNFKHNIISYANNLGGHSSSTQSVIAIPQPGNDSIYYIFTTDGHGGATGYPAESNGTGAFAYSILNMSKNNGEGEVTTKFNVLFTVTTEKLSAVQHCNGEDYWVVAHKLNSNELYAYLVTSDGMDPSTVVISATGTSHKYYRDNGVDSIQGFGGCMKFSPDGSKLALTIMELEKGSKGMVEIFDFDNTTGIFSNPIKLPNIDKPSGLSFSPNGELLYVTEHTSIITHVFQYDLTSWDSVGINNSIDTVFVESSPDYYMGQLQLGLDGKIYGARNKGGLPNSYLSIIHNPNVQGVGCNYEQDGLLINSPRECVWGLPNYIESLLLPPIDAGSDTPVVICIGDSVLLGGVPTGPSWVTFQWTPNEGLESDTIANPWAFPDTTTTYTVTYTSKNGCIQRIDSVTLIVDNTAALTISDTVVCKGDTVQIGVAQEIFSWSKFSWTPSEGLTYDSIPNPLAFPDSTTIYILKVYSGICTDLKDTLDSITITVNQLPLADAGPDKYICPGDSIILGILEQDSSLSYSWMPFEHLNNSTLQNPIYYSNKADTGAVLLFMNYIDNNSCTGLDSVNIYYNNVPLVDAGSDTLIIKDHSIKLNGEVLDHESFFWSNGHLLSDSLLLDPLTIPLEETIIFYLRVYSDSGCMAYDSLIVTIIEKELITLPLAFTPNNDGNNDVINLLTLGIKNLNYFRIYNRWGQLIFETNSIEDAWDGLYKELPQENGEYIYAYEALSLDNRTIVNYGSLILIR